MGRQTRGWNRAGLSAELTWVAVGGFQLLVDLEAGADCSQAGPRHQAKAGLAAAGRLDMPW